MGTGIVNTSYTKLSHNYRVYKLGLTLRSSKDTTRQWRNEKGKVFPIEQISSWSLSKASGGCFYCLQAFAKSAGKNPHIWTKLLNLISTEYQTPGFHALKVNNKHKGTMPCNLIVCLLNHNVGVWGLFYHREATKKHNGIRAQLQMENSLQPEIMLLSFTFTPGNTKMSFVTRWLYIIFPHWTLTSFRDQNKRALEMNHHTNTGGCPIKIAISFFTEIKR